MNMDVIAVLLVGDMAVARYDRVSLADSARADLEATIRLRLRNLGVEVGSEGGDGGKVGHDD